MLNHRKMANVFHYIEPTTIDRIGGGLGHFGCCEIIIFTGEERHLAFVCINSLNGFSSIPIYAIVIHVAFIDAGAALAVIPPIFAATCLWR